jgi:hypothetical protein
VQRLIDDLLDLSESIRAVAVYHEGELVSRVRPGAPEPWSAESDRYEELLVNPALLTLVGQRGKVDRGGARYTLVRYDKFFRLIVPIDRGHVSLCIEPTGQPVMLAGPVLQTLDRAEERLAAG